jgi:hypothetical protein
MVSGLFFFKQLELQYAPDGFGLRGKHVELVQNWRPDVVPR